MTEGVLTPECRRLKLKCDRECELSSSSSVADTSPVPELHQARVQGYLSLRCAARDKRVSHYTPHLPSSHLSFC